MKTVILDPGHGGRGHLTGFGATGNGLLEKDLNLLIGRYCRGKLLEYDCRIIMTRDSDVDISFTDRANVARHNNADLLVSLHLNGFNDQRANGFESFIFNGTLSQNTINYQHSIHNKIYSLLEPHGVRDRGKKKANFAMLRLPPCSCVLPEYAFITNTDDANVIRQPGMVKLLGEYTALGIVDALKLNEKQPTPKPPTTVPEVLRPILIQIDGRQTSHEAWLLKGDDVGTFGRLHPILTELGFIVEGTGDILSIRKR